MSERTAIENWMLHAYADGELDAHERQEVESRLASDPETRAEVEAWRGQKAAIKAEFDAVLKEPVPASVMAALRRRGPSPWYYPALIAAGLALVAIAGVAGWYTANQLTPMRTASFVDRAILAYEVYSAEGRHAVEVGPDEREHLVSWLSKRVGHPLKVPDLQGEGYTLLGGRLLDAENRPAAQLIYENAGKRRIAIFLAANTGGKETDLMIEKKGAVTACYWRDENLGFVVTGATDRDELMSVANAVYRQFDG